jgi:hypothetical protein
MVDLWLEIMNNELRAAMRDARDLHGFTAIFKEREEEEWSRSRKQGMKT